MTDNVEELRQEIDRFNQLVDNLQTQNAKLHKKIGTLYDDLEQADENNASLVGELDAAYIIIEALKEEVSELEADIAFSLPGV